MAPSAFTAPLRGGVDFLAPPGEPALFAPQSVAWRIYKNPVSLFIGGVAAVILELAEPRVRSGVWDHTSFRTDPLARLKRTGAAAMATVYGPRSAAERMIARIGVLHSHVRGVTPGGLAYRADDPELLDWVQATAAWGFLTAYHRYVRPIPRADRDRFFREGAEAAALYGARGALTCEADWEALLAATLPRLERHAIVFEFLEIMDRVAAAPAPLRPLQRALVRAAVVMTPPAVRDVLGLGAQWTLSAPARLAIRMLAGAADRMALPNAPPVLACRRMGLRADFLYR